MDRKTSNEASTLDVYMHIDQNSDLLSDYPKSHHRLHGVGLKADFY